MCKCDCECEECTQVTLDRLTNEGEHLWDMYAVSQGVEPIYIQSKLEQLKQDVDSQVEYQA